MSGADDLPDREGAAEQLKAIILRLENLAEERSAISADMADVRKEAKVNGFDVPTIGAIIKRRKIERDKGAQAVLEADLLLETYEQALGCGAAAAGMLSAKLGEDGVFKIEMVSGPSPEAEKKLSKSAQARRDAVALAELARRAREEQ